MTTKFNVLLNNKMHVVAVNADNYEALATVMIACLKHYAQMSHEAAVKLYTVSTKQCRNNSFSISNKDISISISNNDDFSVVDVVFDHNTLTM